MTQKLPYYMAYPMPLAYDDERVERRDYEYMRSMYPDAAKRILPYVEEECDRMEYEGSMLYDEYPDKLQMRLMCRRVYDRVLAEERDFLEEYGGWERKTASPAKPDWLRNLIEVLMYQELYKRRAENRKTRRRFY